MNLIVDEEVKKKNKKMKAIMIIIFILIILLVILGVGIAYMIYDVKQTMLKVSVDQKSVTKFAEDTFITENDKLYISIKDFTKLVNYEAHNGAVKDIYSEDVTNCYIQNMYEEAYFTLNSNIIYKRLRNDIDYEYFDIENPVIMKNGKLYVTAEGMQIGSNTKISYNREMNQIKIYTLPFITTQYTAKFANSAIGGDKPEVFSNQKAALYDMVVVMDKEKRYGVNDLEGREIIGTKYRSIKFAESSKEFIVQTDENKMGILSANGVTKIQPTYDEIKQIDKKLELYLVENNKKQGVINQNGNTLIHLEYDKIGIDVSQFTSNNIKNQYLLYDNCIPVQRDKKWGIFDKTGKLIVQIEYDDIGCVTGTQDGKSTNNTLLIPKYEGIIVKKNKKYGMITSLGRLLVPVELEKVYSITNSGEEKFYMVYYQQHIDMVDYIDDWYKKQEEKKKNESVNTVDKNIIANELNNNTSTNDVNSNVATNEVANAVSNNTTK